MKTTKHNTHTLETDDKEEHAGVFYTHSHHGSVRVNHFIRLIYANG